MLGPIEFAQMISFLVSPILLLFFNVGRNLANIILFLGFCTLFTPFIGVPLYFWFIKQ